MRLLKIRLHSAMLRRGLVTQIQHKNFWKKWRKFEVLLSKVFDTVDHIVLLRKLLDFTSCNTFLKNKTRSGTSHPHSLHEFWIKIFLILCSIKWPNLFVQISLLLLFEISCNMFVVIVCNPVCDVMIFSRSPLSFLINQLSCLTKKVRTKI